MTSKAVERAICLLDVLSGNRLGLTRDEIRYRVPGYEEAGSDSAFERMFERDKQVLRALGLDLEAERVPYEDAGFVYRLDISRGRSQDFSAADLAFLATAARAWDGTELERTARSALMKLEAGRPRAARGPALSARFVDRVGLAECLTAVADGKALRFRYRSEDQEPRTVTVWGLGMRFGHWYIEGWDRSKKAARLFRLDRMVGLSLVTAEGPAAPEGYSMAHSLANLEPHSVPVLATVPQHGNDDSLPGAGGEPVSINPSFSLEESVLKAIASGKTHCLADLDSLPAGVESGYQDAALEAEVRLRQVLTSWHRAPVTCEIPAGRSIWKSVAPQRSRESASDQLIRLLMMVTVVQKAGGMDLTELATLFETSPAKARIQLEGLAASVGFESLNLTIDEDDFVEVDSETALAAGVKLTVLEALILSLALDLIESIHGLGIGSLLRPKLWDSLGQEGGQAVQPNRVTVAPPDLDPVLSQALHHKVPLLITYRSRTGRTERVIEPLKLILNNGPQYVLAWCRKAQDYRHFALESIENMTLCEGAEFSVHPTSPTTTDTWLADLKSGRHPSQLLVLALDMSLPSSTREVADLQLRRYSTETAQVRGWHFYRIPLANEDWALSLLVRLGPTVRILQPTTLVPKLLNLLSLPPIAGPDQSR
ncbi:helix-turn-helix transcriptional regulator [Rothia nasimurium]|uniref:helix-turn-helix transcriptional regulator n=1 Tax=Rothia nasimurium TaxID=85336 RepID=UPI003BA110A7